MLLSSVNFVAKSKSLKSKENVEKKVTGKKAVENTTDIKEFVCQQCQKEIDEETSMFKFPTTNVVEALTPEQKNEFKTTSGDRVTIATGDDLCLSVEQYFYTIELREESMSDNTCIFRKRVLETRAVPNGHVETVVFALDCDQEFYLTTSKHGDLELNYYTAVPKVEDPDERLFDVYVTNLGHSLIQPKLCPNSYLHHIDQALSVQRLDLNWRCPEEYFFHFNAVPEPMKPFSQIRQRSCPHIKDNVVGDSTPTPVIKDKSCIDNMKDTLPRSEEISSKDIKSETDYFRALPNRERVQLPTKKPTTKKIKLPSLLFGCFSSKGHSIYIQSP